MRKYKNHTVLRSRISPNSNSDRRKITEHLNITENVLRIADSLRVFVADKPSPEEIGKYITEILLCYQYSEADINKNDHTDDKFTGNG